MQLPQRLEEIIALIPKSQRLIDVGTDHALVPIAALCRGIVQTAIGVDKNTSPLTQAKVNRANAGVVENLELQCANGLSEITLNIGDVVIMAGMGGQTIRKILTDNPWRSIGIAAQYRCINAPLLVVRARLDSNCRNLDRGQRSMVLDQSLG